MIIQGKMIFMDWLSEGYDEEQCEDYLEFGHEPFAQLFKFLHGNNISVSYYICDKQCTLDEAQTNFLHQLYGLANVEYFAKYSEDTGALGIDEDFVLGGHNLLDELHSHVCSEEKKWLILCVQSGPNSYD